ncbi:male accessory gland serine protease inhibitor-like [Drosophila obscura]|uniref:male accessory gland serine protease inhibitor-like n=1 Tax=Drosophila obscura TaxID=7282 RepID=UPI000B9FB48E|nr:male accessory gland serine protease inhibitor-like [Drosophila obscura]
MKLIFLVCVIYALSDLSLALKDPICGQEPGKQGKGAVICLAYIPKFTYYPDKNVCVKWIYGGCGQNDNIFEKKEECESKCKE